MSDKLFGFNKWKDKAKKLTKNANALRKRLKELEGSRERSRMKNGKLMSKISNLEKSYKDLENILTKTESELSKPKHHSYSTIIIQVLLSITLQSSNKFRALEKDGKIRAQIIEAYNEAPSHVTIRNWTLKIGYFELIRTKEKANDWIILLDHSIQFGQEKILVVLGIRESVFLKLNRPLKYRDLETLLIKPATNWNGGLVLVEIEKLKKELGSIKYAVADYGSDLRKGLRLSSIVHIHDLSHLISLIIEKIYADDIRYIEFKSEMSKMRSKFIQTDIAPIVPPKGRKKSEYQGFDKIVKWGNSALNLINNKLNDYKQIKELKKDFEPKTLERIKTELSWINEYSGLIAELSELNEVIKVIEKEIKHNGLSGSDLGKSKKILEKLESTNGKKFKETLLLKLKEQFQLLPDTETILFSSDILESTFGKYKNRVSENQMASITCLMLIIAAFTCNLTERKVKESLENVKISDIKKWAQDEVGTSLFKKRSTLFSK